MTELEFSCVRCESVEVFGKAGLYCTAENRSCFCPAGYSGFDDLIAFEDSCHVNEKLQFIFQLVTLVSTALGGLLCLWYTRMMWKKWNINFCHKQKISLSNLMAKDTANRDYNRCRTTILSALSFAIGNLSFVVVYSFLLFGDADALLTDAVFIHSAGLAVGSVFLVSGQLLTTKAIIETLPDIARYGNLLELDPILIKYPRALYRISYCFMGLYTILYSTSTAIIPLSWPEKRFESFYFSVGLVIFSLFVLQILTGFASRNVVFILRKLKKTLIEEKRQWYKKSLRDIENSRNVVSNANSKLAEAEIKALNNSLKVASMMKITAYFVSVAIVCLNIFIVAHRLRHFYFINALIIINTSIGSAFVVGKLAHNTFGGLSPVVQKFTDLAETEMMSST